MASTTGFEDLYKFLYYFTSSLVHFRPDVLLKTGWGNEVIENEKVVKKGKFSTKSYNQYYYCVNQYYSLLLFIEQTNKFQEYLKLSTSMIKLINKIEDLFRNMDWPEIVTHNNLNLQQPSQDERMKYREYQKKKSDSL